MSTRSNPWPALDGKALRETADTLQRWTQIVGKIRLVQSPWINHSWGVALYVTARGLTTSPIPYPGRVFEIDFDFVAHRLVIATAEGETREVPLRARTIADFHRDLFAQLAELGMKILID